MESSLHSKDIFAAELTEDKVPFMAGSCRYCKMGNLAIFDYDRILYLVSQFTKATAEDDTCKWFCITKSALQVLYRLIYLYYSFVNIIRFYNFLANLAAILAAFSSTSSSPGITLFLMITLPSQITVSTHELFAE